MRDPAATIVDGPAVTQLDGAAAAPVSLLRLPEALAGRFTVERHLPAAGGEAELLVVGDPLGTRYVAKIYRHGITPKSEVLERVATRSPSHVIRLYEHGQSEGAWYELLEFAEHGSLRALMSGQPLSDGTARRIFAELAAAVRHLHDAGIVHRDLKPENVLIRTLEPLDLVLTDFGIASVAEHTQHFTSTSRTLRYAAPEAGSGVIGKPVDYWALGMIMTEALAGRHPFEGLSDQVVTLHMLTRPIDLTGVPDDWRALCDGLLQRDPALRWGAEQVGRWLTGDRSIAAVRAAAPTGAVAATPYVFAGKGFTTLPDLVRALASDWPTAVKDTERGLIGDWVRTELKDLEAFRFLQDLLDDRRLTPDLRFFRLLARYAGATFPPVWRGRLLGPDDIAGLAAAATAGDSTAAEVLNSAYANAVLAMHSQLSGTSDGEDLHADWVDAVNAYFTAWDHALTLGVPGYLRPPVDRALRCRLLLALLRPEALDPLRREVARKAADGAAACPWFAALGDAAAASPAELMVMAQSADAAIRAADRRELQAEQARSEDSARDAWRGAWPERLGIAVALGLLFGAAMMLLRLLMDVHTVRWWYWRGDLGGLDGAPGTWPMAGGTVAVLGLLAGLVFVALRCRRIDAVAVAAGEKPRPLKRRLDRLRREEEG